MTATIASRQSRARPRRRIVFFTPGFHEAGGAAQRSRLIARELALRGYSVRVIGRAGTLARPRLTREQGLVALELPGFGRRRLGGLLYLACAVPLGVLWGRRCWSFMSLQLVSPSSAAAVCSWIRRRPFVALGSTSGRLAELDDVLGSRFSSLRRRLLGRASFLVAQTPFGADELKRVVRPDKIATVPTPVAPVRPAALNGRPRALYCGRFSEEKDLPRLISAWRVVAEGRVDAELRLVGAGGSYRSVEASLRAQVAEDPGLRRSVSFTGWLDDVGAELAAADVFVFPSLSEGMSNALLEACSWRRVVVASDIPPNRAVLGDDYPLLFRAGETTSLIAALRAALDDGHVRGRAIDAIERRLPEFSIQVVVDRLEALLDAADRSRHQ